MENEKNKITQAGKDQLIDQLESAKKEKIEILERLAIAREFGDLKENSEYQEAKTSLRQIEQKINEIQNFLATCFIAEVHSQDCVQFGSKFQIKNLDTNSINEYTIVSDLESNILEGLLSESSPLAIAMLGKKINEEFVLKTDRGEKKFLILSIE